ARKTSAGPAKKALLDDAVRDLKLSVGKGIDSSKAPLEAAKAELEKLAADPAVQVKPATPAACPAYLAEQMIRFRRNLAQVPTLSDLRAMTKSEFEITFTLPAPQEMVVDY